MLTISRRDFLKGSVAIGVAGALGDVVFNTLKPSKAYADEQNPAGTEIMYRPTHCLGCTSWCALEAVVQKDTSTNIHRVVDVTGNRKDGRVSGEWNGDIGFACPRAKLSIQEFYDPDRLKAPLRRTNPNKGRYVNPQFVADTWDNALNDIAKELIKIRYTPDPYDLRLTGTIESVNGQTITATKDAIGNTIIANSTSDYYKGMIFVCGDVKRMIANSSVDANGRLTLTISSETKLADGEVVVGSPFEIRPSQAHKVMTNRGRYSYPLENILYSNFASILGTPNKVSHSSLCAEAEKTAWAMVEGKFTYMDYDIENTKYMLLWGVDPLSSNRMVSAAIQRIANKLANDPDFKITVIDPRLSPIAAKAHRWLPIKPGTDGALALAIAYHILYNSDLDLVGRNPENHNIKIQEDPVLSNFVAVDDSKRTFGLKRYWEYLTGGIDGITKDPAWAADKTGLDELEIKKVACEFAGYVPDENGDPTTTRMPGRDGEGICHAMSWTGPGVAMAPNGVYGGAAAAALNGLIGSFDHKGGIFSKTASISGTGSVPTPGDSHKDPISNAKYSYYRGGKERKYATYDNKGPRVNTDPKIPFDMIAMNGNDFSIGATTPTNRVADALKHKMPYTQVTYQSGVGEVDLGTVAPNNCRMVIAYMNNWVFSATGVERWEEGLKNVGKLVHITTNVSEFSMFADWVLPSDHHCFENYLASPSKANFHNTIAIGRPVAPVGENPNDPQSTKLWDTYWPETEFVYKLAEKMTGIKVGDVVSGWKDGTADYYFKKLWDYVQSVGSPTSAWDFNKKCIKKYATNQYSDSDPIWSKIDSDNPADFTDLGTGQAYGFGIRTGDLNQQGWFDTNGRGKYWRRDGNNPFGTASERIEFSCRGYDDNAIYTKLRKAIDDFTKDPYWTGKTWKDVITALNYDLTAGIMASNNDDPINDIAFMPHWEDANIAGSESEYPFILVDHKSRLNREGRSQNCPWYYEFKVCDTEDERNLDVVKVHPSYPLPDGTRVKIISPNAPLGLVCILRKSYGVPKGVAVKCYGQGHWAYGRYASKLVPDGNPKLNTANNNQIMQAEFERLSGSNARNAVTRVKIVPA